MQTKGEYDLAIQEHITIGRSAMDPSDVRAHQNSRHGNSAKRGAKVLLSGMTAALAEQAESIRKTFGTLKPEEMLRHYEERAKEYESRVKKERPETREYAERLPWRLIGYFLGFAFLYFALLCIVAICASLIGPGNGFGFGATIILPLTLGFVLIAYPLVSELRRRREEDRLNEVCAEDSRRKGFIAGYMLAHEDKETRDKAIAEFQKHLGDKSAAEFLSEWGKSAKDDDRPSWKNIIKNSPASSVAEDD